MRDWILFLIVASLVLALIVVRAIRAPTWASTTMSPAQCQVAGGCGMEWTPIDGRYSDGTLVQDYDRWGTYVGPPERRPSCCSIRCGCKP